MVLGGWGGLTACSATPAVLLTAPAMGLEGTRRDSRCCDSHIVVGRESDGVTPVPTSQRPVSLHLNIPGNRALCLG